MANKENYNPKKLQAKLSDSVLDEEKMTFDFAKFFDEIEKEHPNPYVKKRELCKPADIKIHADEIRKLLSIDKAKDIYERVKELEEHQPQQEEQSSHGYEYVNHPSHYNMYSVEAINMIERIYGKEFMPLFCEATALLYRLRMGTKPDNSIQQELDKERWWLQKRDEYKAK